MNWRCMILVAGAVRSWRRLAVRRLPLVVAAAFSLASALAQTPGTVLSRVYTLPLTEGGLTALTLGQDGNLYGTTQSGGLSTGTVFKLNSDGTLTTLRRFTSADGGGPGGLFQGADGNFYGETTGGSDGPHTIFRLTPAGALTTLHTIPSGTTLFGLLLANDGNVYGTTVSLNAANVVQPGSGTIFRLGPSGNFTCFAPFGKSGYSPVTLIQGMDGSLCGTAFYTPSPPYSVPLDLSTRGELFRFIAADDTITPLVRLNQRAGLPTANLLEDSDGNSYSLGFVYPVTEATTPPPAPLPTPVPEVVLDKITLAGQRTVFPVAPGYTRGLTMGQAGNFYVAITETAVESASSTATIFAVSPDNGTKAALYEFSGLSSADPATAGFPLSRLIQAADGSLYGLAADANSTFIYRLDVTAPSVTLTASVPTVVAGGSARGKFLLTLSAPWPYDLSVAYTVGGTATPGADYQALSGLVTFPAGRTTAIVPVKPGQTLGGATKRTVKLTLGSGAGYVVGASGFAKVRIFAP